MAEQLAEFSKGAALVYGGSGGIGVEICRSRRRPATVLKISGTAGIARLPGVSLVRGGT
jgi:hypothetical protein